MNNWQSHSLLGGIQNGTATLENSLTVAFKIKHPLRQVSAVILQGIFQGEMKTCLHTKNCLNIVISLFVMAKIWKQSKYSLTDKQPSKLQQMEYDLLKCTPTANIHESPKDHANRMNPIILKVYIMCGPIYVTL